MRRNKGGVKSVVTLPPLLPISEMWRLKASNSFIVATFLGSAISAPPREAGLLLFALRLEKIDGLILGHVQQSGGWKDKLKVRSINKAQVWNEGAFDQQQDGNANGKAERRCVRSTFHVHLLPELT
jgi:hypothetical protein